MQEVRLQGNLAFARKQSIVGIQPGGWERDPAVCSQESTDIILPSGQDE